MSSKEQSDTPSVKHGRDLTTGSIPRHLIAFSLPMLAGSAIQTAYSIVNAIWVGQGLGTTALAAVTVSFPVFFVLMAVAGGLTMAANILASQSYGAKDWPYFKRVVNNSVILVTVMSTLCVAIGHFYAEPLLKLMDTPREVLPLAVGYLRIFIWAMPFMFGIFLVAALLRGTGDSKTPLYFQAAFLGMNAVLDPLFMFGWLGFPKLGLDGTAVATIVTNAGAVLTVAAYLQWKRHIVAPDWRQLKIHWETIWLTIKIGVPSMVQQSMVSIGMLVIVGLVNAFGENAAAGFGAAIRIDNLAFMPAITVGMAVSTLSGQNIGANQHDRVKEVFKWGLVIGCGMALFGSLIIVTFPALLLKMFIKDPVVIAIGVHYLRIVGSAYVVLAVMFVSNGVINGAGHTLITTLITLIGLWGVRVPLAVYLSKSTHDLDGIWYAMVFGFTTGAILSLTYYFSGRWKKPVSRKLPGGAPEQTDADPTLPISDIIIE